jgi:Na+/phosphate symporter
LLLVILFILYRSHLAHKQKKVRADKAEKHHKNIETIGVVQSCNQSISESLSEFVNVINTIFEALYIEDRKKLKAANKEVQELNVDAKKLKKDMPKTIERFKQEDVETGHYYVQVLDYLREIAHTITFITGPCLEHVDNNHKGLLPEQVNELDKIQGGINKLLKMINKSISEQDFSKLEEVLKQQQHILEVIDTTRKNQIKRIKANEAGTKNSLLYLNILSESKNLVLYAVNALKSHRDFVNDMNGE